MQPSVSVSTGCQLEPSLHARWNCFQKLLSQFLETRKSHPRNSMTFWILILSRFPLLWASSVPYQHDSWTSLFICLQEINWRHTFADLKQIPKVCSLTAWFQSLKLKCLCLLVFLSFPNLLNLHHCKFFSSIMQSDSALFKLNSSDTKMLSKTKCPLVRLTPLEANWVIIGPTKRNYCLILQY